MDFFSEWLDLLQWPAMLATVLAAWLVASNSKRRRNWVFWNVPGQQCAVGVVGVA